MSIGVVPTCSMKSRSSIASAGVATLAVFFWVSTSWSQERDVSSAERRTILVNGQPKVIVSRLSSLNPNNDRIPAVLDLNFTFNFQHDQGKPVVSAMLNRLAQSEGWSITQYNSSTPGKPGIDDRAKVTVEELQKYQVIFANNISDLGSDKPPLAMKTAIESYMEETGGGMILIHGSGETYRPPWSYFRDKLHPVGFEGHASQIRNTIRRTGQAGSHPILDGGIADTGIKINSEPYSRQFSIIEKNPKAEILLELDSTDQYFDPPHERQISWVMPVGKGWVGYFQEGHDTNTEKAMTQPVWDRFFKQMLYYVAGYDTLDVSPILQRKPSDKAGISFEASRMGVTIQNPGPYRIRILDVRGRAIHLATGTGQQKHSFNEIYKRLQPGLYTLRVECENGISVSKKYLIH
jgi:Trehalose utilisation